MKLLTSINAVSIIACKCKCIPNKMAGECFHMLVFFFFFLCFIYLPIFFLQLKNSSMLGHVLQLPCLKSFSFLHIVVPAFDYLLSLDCSPDSVSQANWPAGVSLAPQCRSHGFIRYLSAIDTDRLPPACLSLGALLLTFPTSSFSENAWPGSSCSRKRSLFPFIPFKE